MASEGGELQEYSERTAIKKTFSQESDSRQALFASRSWLNLSVIQSFPKRYVVALLGFLGFCNVYTLRVNLSIAIVAMTSNKTQTDSNGTNYTEPEFDWDTRQQGYILGSFFYGYIVTQIPAGWLASKVGGKVLLGSGVFVAALFTVVTPICAETSIYLLIACRVLEGLFEGVAYPSMHQLWSNWAPPLERTKLTTIAFSGSYVGTVVALLLSGVLAENVGWQSVFYFFGVLAVVWFIVWGYVVVEYPYDHPTISNEELEYIQASIGFTHQQVVGQNPPWSRLFTSLPVWAIVLAHFAANWGFYTLLTTLPMFLHDVFKFQLDLAGFASACPYFVMALAIVGGGYVADLIRKRGTFNTTNVRKIFNCGAFVCQTIFMVMAAYTMTPAAAVSCITLAVGFGGIAWSGFSVNHLDIAPQFAGVLMGLSNCVATIPGIVSPIITGQIVKDKTAGEWELIFYIAAAVYLVGAIFYGLFASGEKQKWADVPSGYSPCTESSEDVPYGTG